MSTSTKCFLNIMAPLFRFAIRSLMPFKYCLCYCTVPVSVLPTRRIDMPRAFLGMIHFYWILGLNGDFEMWKTVDQGSDVTTEQFSTYWYLHCVLKFNLVAIEFLNNVPGRIWFAALTRWFSHIWRVSEQKLWRIPDRQYYSSMQSYSKVYNVVVPFWKCFCWTCIPCPAQLITVIS